MLFDAVVFGISMSASADLGLTGGDGGEPFVKDSGLMERSIHDLTYAGVTECGDGSGESKDASKNDDKASSGIRRLLGLKKKPEPNNSDVVPKHTAEDVHGEVEPSTPPAQFVRHVPPPVFADERRSLVQSPPLSMMAASPPSCIRSASPRIPSPASSQIFERNVQESTVVPSELSPAIPSHIQTENLIPPVLEASSLAITDEALDPDEVEIVTHSVHLPAAAATGFNCSMSGSDGFVSSPQSQSFYSTSQSIPMSQSGTHHTRPVSPFRHLSDESNGGASSSHHQHHHHHELEESNYGSLEPGDVKRLSFISFADVVQAEQAESLKESVFLGGLGGTNATASLSSSPSRGGLGAIRGRSSPSPVRSPASLYDHHPSVGGWPQSSSPPSPPRSGAPSLHGFESTGSLGGVTSSSFRGVPASPTTASSLQHGELTIETMRQAVRKTGNSELGTGGPRSQPISPVLRDEFLDPLHR